MTNYNERLDKILNRVVAESIQISSQQGEISSKDYEDYLRDIKSDAKQAILDWHNRQVKNAVVTAEDNLDQYWNKELDKQVEEAMAKFHLKKGVKYDVKASDSVIVITHTNKLKESK